MINKLMATSCISKVMLSHLVFFLFNVNFTNLFQKEGKSPWQASFKLSLPLHLKVSSAWE